MARPGDARHEIEALRERISTLSAAILRISATLDLDNVLAEVVESARTLTGARYGVIATVDETGAPTRESVFSGFTPDEERELAAWPDSGRLFEHLRHLPGPLGLTDLSGYVRALGIAPARMFSRTFQGTPMRHRGADVGHFFLAEKADGEEFTGDDEEVLTLFASQAAAAITNARTHRGERRARADLEALVETCRSASWSWTPAPAGRSRSTARPGASSRACGRQAVRPSTSWRWSRSAAPTDGRCHWPRFRSSRRSAPARRCAPRRWCSRSRTGAASGRSSTPRRSGRKETRSGRWW